MWQINSTNKIVGVFEKPGAGGAGWSLSDPERESPWLWKGEMVSQGCCNIVEILCENNSEVTIVPEVTKKLRSLHFEAMRHELSHGKLNDSMWPVWVSSCRGGRRRGLPADGATFIFPPGSLDSPLSTEQIITSDCPPCQPPPNPQKLSSLGLPPPLVNWCIVHWVMEADT